jgi:hypothetical protein
MIIASGTELAEAGEVERDGDVLAVGGDDFDGGVVGGDVVGVVDEPSEPAGGVDVAVGAGVGEGGAFRGCGVGEKSEVFGDEGVVV